MSDARAARATLLVLFSACCFGSISTFITLATRTGVRLVDVLAWRYVIAAALLVFVAGGARAVVQPGARAVRATVLAGAGQAGIAFISLSALRYIPVATLTFLFYTYPAWVAVIAAVRGTERLTTRRAIALALSLAGIALMVGTPGSGAGAVHPIGVMLALSSALLYAAYIPMIDWLGRGMTPALTSTYASAGAALILAGVAATQGGPTIHMAPIAWTSIVALAVVCTVLAFITFLRGLAAIGPVRTAIVSTIEPFWTALLGSVVLGQPLGARTFAGGVCIAGAVLVLHMSRPATAPAPAA